MSPPRKRKIVLCIAKASGVTHLHYEDGGKEVFGPDGRRITQRPKPKQ